MGKTVLIVDDDPMARRLLEHHLGQAGYDVVTAADGRAAMEKLAAERPSMVLTDWEMPHANGAQLCRQIREEAHHGWVYTIVLTASEGEESLLEAFEAGADDYLTKPFNRRELLARMRAGERILDLERSLATKTNQIAQSKIALERANERLAEANARLDRMALTDDLTGLANRRAAMRSLECHWEESSGPDGALACIMLDLDGFKAVNDTHGHQIGDRVLVAIAQALQTETRDAEPIFRIGGEEFLILCPRSNAPMTSRAAERLRTTVEDLAIDANGIALPMTASFGVAERTATMVTEDHLLAAADDALYDAKRSGRNCVRVAPTPPHRLSQTGDDERRASA